jgi:hypothetical protein
VLGAGIAIAGIVLAVRRKITGKALLKWKDNIEVDVGASIFLVVLGLGMIVLSYQAYSPGIQRHLDDVLAADKDLRDQLATAKHDEDETRGKLQTTEHDLNGARQEIANAELARQKLVADLAHETADRREAEAAAQKAWVAFDTYKMNDLQRAAFNKLAQDVDQLNANLKYVQIALTAWPKLDGPEAVATFEIFNKEWEPDETRPRGAGLFDFDETEITIRGDYKGRLAEAIRTEMATSICTAAQSALVHGVPLPDAISRIPRVAGLDVPEQLVGQLTEVVYVYAQMRLKLRAGHTLVLVRGYADGEKTSWSRTLGPAPRTLMVHANTDPHAKQPEYALTFRAALSPVEVGRMDKGSAIYGNTDLPDLRGAAVAEILTALIDGCRRIGGTGSFTEARPTPVEILDGQVYPQHSVPDRKARVHVVAYLDER